MPGIDTRQVDLKDMASSEGRKFLSCFLGDEEYGFDVLSVREITGLRRLTPVPGADAYFMGVINLRGRIIAVIDLRVRLGMEPVSATRQSCVIVVEVAGVEAGVLVDRVSEVRVIPDENIEPVPALGLSPARDFIAGIGRVDERIRLLLNLEAVLDRNVRATLHASATAGESDADAE